MNDGYQWWLILVGAVIALAVVLVFAARLPRDEADVSEEERRAEAVWISHTIERFGGVAPEELVEEVLDLHAEYLASPRLARIPAPASAAPEAAHATATGAGEAAQPPLSPPPATGRPDRQPPANPSG